MPMIINEDITAEASMFQYKIKSNEQMCMNVLSETDDSFYVHIITLRDGYEIEKKVSMSRRLFETLLSTGYIQKLSAANAKPA